ncbi:MAG TPA: hypothetical protein VGP33_08090 [Chloroflexota bacterium]|jgi:hypothetical protein|nr:hypothetical protein [Chloroflexota bacterium]
MRVIPRVALVAVGVLALVVAVVTYRDVAQADAVRVMVRVTPPILPGDNVSKATITLQYLNSDGTARAGDQLDLLDISQNTGTILRPGSAFIEVYRMFTDKQGKATFKYIAAMSNSFVPTVPAHIQVTDSSLGTILEIDKTTNVTINVVDPAKIKGGRHGTHA